MYLEEWLLLLLLQKSQEELQGFARQKVLEIKKDEPKRPGQALMGKSRVGLGDSESAQGWPDSVRGWPQCASSSQLGLHGQSQRILK